jgi:hypothetical protein
MRRAKRNPARVDAGLRRFDRVGKLDRREDTQGRALQQGRIVPIAATPPPDGLSLGLWTSASAAGHALLEHARGGPIRP